MSQEHLESSLEGIRQLLSQLHGEVTVLEDTYDQVLLVLRKLEGAYDRDDLTGLFRRNAFFSKWEALLGECERLNESCGILLIDIDHFKRINDTHGHPTGDEVLKRVASMLKQFESPGCIVGRYGGEEFILGVKGTDAEILGLAEMIRCQAERLTGSAQAENEPSFAIERRAEWRCTLSAGIASARRIGFDAPRLLKAADVALYEAKRSGRNRVKAA